MGGNMKVLMLSREGGWRGVERWHPSFHPIPSRSAPAHPPISLVLANTRPTTVHAKAHANHNEMSLLKELSRGF
eukprot:5432271-Prymnesium_polylepis.2